MAASRMSPAAALSLSHVSRPVSRRLTDVHGGDLLTLFGHGVVTIRVGVGPAERD
jgi:hypothetical protein